MMTADRQHLCMAVLCRGTACVLLCVCDLHSVLRGNVCNRAHGTYIFGLVDITFVTTHVFD